MFTLRYHFFSSHVVVDERIVAYLLGNDRIDTRLLPYARHWMPAIGLEDVLLPADTRRRLLADILGVSPADLDGPLQKKEDQEPRGHDCFPLP
jgi:hypothetical protein